MRRELDLAGELSVTHQHVSRIELGDATQLLAMLLKVNRRLGVSTDYLLTGQSTAPPTPLARSARSPTSARPPSATSSRSLTSYGRGEQARRWTVGLGLVATNSR